MSDRNKLNDGWIPAIEYGHILERVPTLCVDLLPLSVGADSIGLIRRETYGGGQGWCMVGGAVKRNEPLVAAIERHVKCTLGDDIGFELPSPQPLWVAEYFTRPEIGDLHDPRKHAVALTYAATFHSDAQAQPRGEALEFRWFGLDELGSINFGFGQGSVVERVLAIDSSS